MYVWDIKTIEELVKKCFEPNQITSIEESILIVKKTFNIVSMRDMDYTVFVKKLETLMHEKPKETIEDSVKFSFYNIHTNIINLFLDYLTRGNIINNFMH